MSIHEIRVRPVVRYIVTEYKADDDMRNASSSPFGVFDSVHDANRVAEAMAVQAGDGVNVEPARALRIDWNREPGAPKESIWWTLHEIG